MKGTCKCGPTNDDTRFESLETAWTAPPGGAGPVRAAPPDPAGKSPGKVAGTAYPRVVTLAFLLAVVVSTLGAYVRLSDAGLSCPDWPGCYGRLGVPGPSDALAAQAAFPDRPLDRTRAWKEMAHRYAAGLLGVLVVVIGVLAWRRSRPGRMPALPWVLVGLVAFQALLGMWTVVLGLAPLVVTSHLLAGLATVALLWWLRLQVTAWARLPRPAFRRSGAAALRPWTLGALLVIAVQIALGGWTSANYAALACPDFPLCQGRILPPLDLREAFTLWPDAAGADFEGGVHDNDARVTIHLAHRLGAVLTLLYVIGLGGRILASAGLRRLKAAAALLLVAVVTQVGLGIANVVLGLPIVLAVGHNAGAILLLLSALTVYHMVHPVRCSLPEEGPEVRR